MPPASSSLPHVCSRMLTYGRYAKPEGVCLVVGTCARGPWVDNSKGGDLIFSFTPIDGDRQYFWEAFPSQDLHGSRKESRTTYMFTYVDADTRTASRAHMFHLSSPTLTYADEC